jgi:hypothetical protein
MKHLKRKTQDRKKHHKPKNGCLMNYGCLLQRSIFWVERIQCYILQKHADQIERKTFMDFASKTKLPLDYTGRREGLVMESRDPDKAKR